MQRPQRRLCGLVAVLGLLSSAATPLLAASPIVVRPSEGSKGLSDALERAREARVVERGKPIRIVLKPGHYALTEPLLITSADSGTAKAPLVIEAERPGTVTLSGGPLLSLKEQSQGRWYFDAPEGRDGLPERAGGQLYVNGKRAVLAREPDAGSWWFVRAPSNDTLFMAPQDAEKAKALLAGQQDRAIVQLMQSWTSGQHRAEGFTGKGDGIKLQPAPKWPMLSFGTAQRYFIENVPGALDSPGEWLPQGGHVTYIPRPEDKALANGKQAIQAVWPRLATLLKIQGDEGRGDQVSHVIIKGLRFAHTAVSTPARGWVDMQAALDVPAAIEIDQANHITLTACQIGDTGGHGVWLRRGVRDSEVSRCAFDDLGAGAIKIGDHQRGAGDPPTGHNTIRGNSVLNTGRAYPGAVAIWIGKSGDNVVANNVIGHTSYTGISLGWTWGFEPQGADNNIVKDNVLFDIGQGTLSDIGGIYTLGQGRGTRITGNLIRQVQDYPHYGAGAWGIYNDEGSSNLTVDGNVVLGTRTGGYHLHYGRDNNVSRNIFAGGGEAEVTWSNPARSGKWQLKQTTTSRKSGAADVNINSPQAKALRGDMGLSEDPNEIAHADVTGGSAVTDVRIGGAGGAQKAVLDAVVKSAQATVQSLAGMQIDTPRLSMPAVAATSRPPVLPRAWAFEDMPAGGPPPGFEFEPALKPPIVKVDDDPDPKGPGRCLLLIDGAPNLKKYEPYIFMRPNFPLGGSSTRFTIKLDDASRIIHEWRDRNRANYKSILKLVMSAERGLELDGKTLAPLPQGQWLDITVDVAAGAQPSSWNLTLAIGQNNRRQWKNLPLLTGQVPDWGWVGWISDGTSPARTCLGRIAIEPADAGPPH